MYIVQQISTIPTSPSSPSTLSAPLRTDFPRNVYDRDAQWEEETLNEEDGGGGSEGDEGKDKKEGDETLKGDWRDSHCRG